MQYTETQLTKLIEDVEKEFTTHLAKAEEDTKVLSATPEELESIVTAPTETLAKAEEKKPEEKEEAKEEHKPEAKDAKPEAEGEKKEAEAKPAEEASAHDHKDHDYDAEDMAHLEKMYMSMSKGELLAHHDMAKSALDKCMAKCGDISQEKSVMAKSEEVKPIEIKTEEVTPNQEVELLKSELNTTNTKFEELKKNYDAVAAFLTKLVEKKSAPAAKAITSLEVIAKSEDSGEEKTLTKSEIDSALNKKSSDPTLKKSDRDAINAYYLSGASINSISHLLK